MLSELITHKERNYNVNPKDSQSSRQTSFGSNYVLTWGYITEYKPAKIHQVSDWNDYTEIKNCIVGKLYKSAEIAVSQAEPASQSKTPSGSSLGKTVTDAATPTESQSRIPTGILEVGQIVITLPSLIQYLIVHPDLRKQGLGSLLLNRAESMLYNQFRRKTVTLIPQSPDLYKFYEDQGYEPTGVVYQDNRKEYKKSLEV